MLALQALEGLEGAEACSGYMFVEQHTEWEAEKKRLQREADRQIRQARVRAPPFHLLQMDARVPRSV